MRRKNRSINSDALLLASLPTPKGIPPFKDHLSLEATALPQPIAHALPSSFTVKHTPLFGALLPAHGSIRKVWVPPNGPGKNVVVHIQDVHQNEDAQRHISRVVDSLLGTHSIGLVALKALLIPST
jgi:hypothetical protein